MNYFHNCSDEHSFIENNNPCYDTKNAKFMMIYFKNYVSTTSWFYITLLYTTTLSINLFLNVGKRKTYQRIVFKNESNLIHRFRSHNYNIAETNYSPFFPEKVNAWIQSITFKELWRIINPRVSKLVRDVWF